MKMTQLLPSDSVPIHLKVAVVAEMPNSVDPVQTAHL